MSEGIPTVVPSPMPSTGEQHGLDVELEGLLAAARRETLVIAAALQRPDHGTAVVGAARLRWILDFTMEYAARRPAEFQRAYPRLSAIMEVAEGWISAGKLSLAPELLHALVFESLGSRSAPIDAGRCMLIGLDLDDLPLRHLNVRGAKLVDIRARRACLEQIDAAGATVQRLNLASAAVRHGIFEHATLEHSDLSHANLEGSRWEGARITHCNFAGALLADAQLDTATFIDCDFRDADLQQRETIPAGPGATPRLERIKFIRCDLRGSQWDRRGQARSSFTRCITSEDRTRSGEVVVRELPDSTGTSAYGERYPADAVTRRARPSRAAATLRAAMLYMFPRNGGEG